MIAKKRLVEGDFPEIGYKIRQEKTVKAIDDLFDGTCKGSNMTGWLYWPRQYLVSDEYARLKKVAEAVAKKNDSVIIVGIGGSYLTPKMLIGAEYGDEYNELANEQGLPRVYFLGCDLSPDRLNRILNIVAKGDFSVVYVSKSGGTLESALAFRTVYKKLMEKYGNYANSRVISITDPNNGCLRKLTRYHGWESFEIPPNIGGRYSGLTACGLLPSAIAGIDTDKLLSGANRAIREEKYQDCFAVQYALWRFYNYMQDRRVEYIASNDPALSDMAEWCKQLWAESEGKDCKGIFPTSGVFPRELHSLGQYLQEGSRNLIFETFLMHEFMNKSLEIPKVALNDNLATKEGKKIVQACSAAFDGAYKAHTQGGNPCGLIKMQSGMESIGYFMQSSFIATAIYCNLLDVNAFDQPGVEKHKNEMKKSSAWDTLK